MARAGAKDGIRRRGGALFGELRRLELMRENGTLSEASYLAARARLMRSVSDADVVEEERSKAAAPSGSRVGRGSLLTLGAAALAAVAMIGAPPEALAWIGLAGLATAALAACWEA